jgi:hypothetical protein
MWKNNRRRFAEKFPTWDIIRKYNKDYKLKPCPTRCEPERFACFQAEMSPKT